MRGPQVPWQQVLQQQEGYAPLSAPPGQPQNQRSSPQTATHNTAPSNAAQPGTAPRTRHVELVALGAVGQGVGEPLPPHDGAGHQHYGRLYLVQHCIRVLVHHLRNTCCCLSAEPSLSIKCQVGGGTPGWWVASQRSPYAPLGTRAAAAGPLASCGGAVWSCKLQRATLRLGAGLSTVLSYLHNPGGSAYLATSGSALTRWASAFTFTSTSCSLGRAAVSSCTSDQTWCGPLQRCALPLTSTDFTFFLLRSRPSSPARFLPPSSLDILPLKNR